MYAAKSEYHSYFLQAHKIIMSLFLLPLACLQSDLKAVEQVVLSWRDSISVDLTVAARNSCL